MPDQSKTTGRFSTQPRIALPGSERAPISTLPPALAAHASRQPEKPAITVILHPHHRLPPGTRISREQLATHLAPAHNAVELLKEFAAEFDLEITPHPSAGPRHYLLSGSEAALEQAFGVTLTNHQIGGKTCRCREGSLYLPQELAPHVAAVLGLDNRPQTQPHFRIATPSAESVSYSPVQVAQLYGVPAGATATGQTIGLIELGGGFEQSDISTYFQGLNLPIPTVTAVPVDNGTNSPGDPNGADGEVMLDIEVSAAVAAGANVAVYFSPNTDQGFIDAISTAIHDTTNKPAVLSISWGGPESSWTAQSVTALDQACQAAAAVGVTITVACGDNGSTDGVTGSANHVDFPASSPHVLACGGTKLTASGTKIKTEVVWNELSSNEGATGGGVSDLFPLPAWQQNANVPAPTTSAGGRGVPDVAGDADPSTGYNVLVDGQTQVIGGTSAVAPLWAGIIALANAQNTGETEGLGFINPTLYQNTSDFNDITSGSNGAFKAGPGWDACSGLGSPKAEAILTTLAPKPAS